VEDSLASSLKDVLPQTPAGFLFAMTDAIGAYLYRIPAIAQAQPEPVLAGV
jgi:hypothetical protein